RMAPSRLLHNEGCVKPGWSQRGPNRYGAGGERSNDFINPMYPAVADLVQWARTTREQRPFIMCEYCSTTGNSGGGLQDYWDAIYAHHGLQGGFIWQWLDHGLRRRDKAGRPYWAYGGDFGEHMHDYNFHCNGLVSADRQPHPALYEYKKLLQPIAVTARDPDKHRFTVSNRDYWRASDWLDASWRLELDGRTLQKGRLACALPPGGSKTVTLPLKPFHHPPGALAVVNFSFRTRRKTAWCPKGHEVAWEQFVIPPPADTRTSARTRPKPELLTASPVQLRRQGHCLTAAVGGTEVRIDRRTGLIAAVRQAGKPVLLQGPVFNLWRASIDNDGLRANPDHRSSPRKLLGRWLAAGYDRLRTHLEQMDIDSSNPSCLVIKVAQHICPARTATGFRHTAHYTFNSAGILHCSHTFHMPAGLVEPARLGVRFMVAAGHEHLEWLGRGPHESYPDRKAGAPLGRYTGTVGEQHHAYVVPQENGLKVDTREFTLRGAGSSVTFQARNPQGFAFSVQHYKPEELERALHINEVKFRPETVVLIDAIHRGVGSAACGPDTLPAYRIHPGDYTLAYDIRLETTKHH
ncbi:MAG: glycoside hydrolase family 2 TIM barrel-domain containing protein, partial [Kiritimatiellia bacterium]